MLGVQRDLVQHMQALPPRDVSATIETVRTSGTEINQDDGAWIIPATRTKAAREHSGTLCRRAVEILEEARALVRGSPLVFPGMGGKPVGNTALSELLRELQVAAVPHGFRSSFPDWAAEETDHPLEVVEAALAHKVRNQVEAAYARSDLFERRRRLMDDWADYLSGEKSTQRPV